MKKALFICSAAFALAAPAVAASTESDVDALARQRLTELRKELDQLKASESDQWLTEERAKEIRSIVQDVLADSDTRASLASSGATAGYDNGFFIASPDGNFKLVVNGQLQLRWAASRLSGRSMYQLDPGTYQTPARGWYNANGGNWPGSQVAPEQFPGTTSSNTAELRGYQGFFGSGNTQGIEKTARGFGVPRAKLEFSGHVVDPSWQFRIVGAFEQQTTQSSFGTVDTAPGLGGGYGGSYGPVYPTGTYGGNYSGGNGSLGSNFGLEDAYVVKVIDPNWSVKVGQFKAPLLREELVSSKYQLAVERSLVNQFFSTEYTQGIELTFQNDCFRVMASFNDGGNNANTSETIGNSSNDGNWTEYAVTGRVEWKAMGNWGQFDSFSSPNGTPTGILIGAAVNWQRGGGGQNPAEPNLALTYQNAAYENNVGGNWDNIGSVPIPYYDGWFGGYNSSPVYAPIAALQYPNNLPTNANDDVNNLTFTVDATAQFGGFSLYGAFIGNIAYNIPAGWVANPSGGYTPRNQNQDGGLYNNYTPDNVSLVMTTPNGIGTAGPAYGTTNGIGPAAGFVPGYGYGNSPIYSYGVVAQAGWFIFDDIEIFGRYEFYTTLNNSQNAYAGNTPTFWGWVPGGSSPFANNTRTNGDTGMFYNGNDSNNPVNANVNTPNDSYNGSTTNPYYAYNLGANPYGAQLNNVMTFGANWFPAGVKNQNIKVTGDISYAFQPVLFGQGIYGRSIAITDFRSDGGMGGGGQWVGRIQLQLLF